MDIKKILAVDDSITMRKMVAFCLESVGYEVVTASDGVAAYEMTQTTKFDLVLTDQHMPRMDGLTLITQLRTVPDYQKTPILMLTTESGDDMKSKGRSAGASGWLVKPFNPDRLLEVVKKLIGPSDCK